MELPRWHTYCQNTTVCNALCFDLGALTVWFSYKTPVAFRNQAGRLVVRKNDWSTTTARHLNAIDGGNKKARVDGFEFEDRLADALRAKEEA